MLSQEQEAVTYDHVTHKTLQELVLKCRSQACLNINPVASNLPHTEGASFAHLSAYFHLAKQY